MHSTILAVGHKMPAWCDIASNEYLKRLQRFMKCQLVEIPPATRHKNQAADLYNQEEGHKILAKISADDFVIALAVKAPTWSSIDLAQKVATWQQHGKNIVFLIGGPDGLAPKCLARANLQWSLSDLTFPHPLVRVLLLEQLYRATSWLSNHPYHRE